MKKIVRADGQPADALPGGCKSGIGNRGSGGGYADFATTARPFAAGHDVDFDHRRGVAQTGDFVIVEIALLHASGGDGDGAFESLRQPEIDGSFHLRLQAWGIDDTSAIHASDHTTDEKIDIL